MVTWPDALDTDEHDERDGLHWKTRTPVDWAAGHSFAWVDGEIAETDRTWVSAHHPGQALLQLVDPRYGLPDADYHTLEQWLRRFGNTPPSAGDHRPCRGRGTPQ